MKIIVFILRTLTIQYKPKKIQMKKVITLAISLLIIATSLATEKITLRLSPSGPERGSSRKYVLLGEQEYKFYSDVRDSLGKYRDTLRLFHKDYRLSYNNYYKELFVVGEGFAHDLIISAALKGKVETEIGRTIKNEAGFSHWGFFKKYQLQTPIISYSRFSTSPLIVSVEHNFIHRSLKVFHFGSIMALIMLLLLGLITGIIISVTPKKYFGDIIDSANFVDATVPIVALFIGQIYSAVWSFLVGPPFTYLAGLAFLTGLLPGLWRIFKKKRVAN